MIHPFNDEYFMKQALNEAAIAFEANEIPIGVVIVAKQQIIARSHNRTEQLNDVTAHAEIQAITAASEYLGSKYLKECTMYTTLEPCHMCAGALYWTQIDKIVFAARNERRKESNLSSKIYHPRTLVVNGLLADESSKLLKSFFAKQRG